MFPSALDPDGCIPGAGTPGAGNSPSASGGSAFFGPNGLLAYTGADVAALVGIALGALVLGALFFLMARRRRRNAAEPGHQPGGRGIGVALGLLMIIGLGVAGSASPAQAQGSQVDVVTACDFLRVTGVTVSPEIGSGLMPGETYNVLTATVTNTASFPADIFLNTAVGSDPRGIAPFTTLTAQTPATTVYQETLADTTAALAVRLQPGESVNLAFRAAVSPNAGNPQQAARIVFDIVITAAEVR